MDCVKLIKIKVIMNCKHCEQKQINNNNNLELNLYLKVFYRRILKRGSNKSVENSQIQGKAR